MIKSYLYKRISPFLAITIIIILAVILIGGIIAYQYHLAPKEKSEAEVEEGIKFRLIDGDTGQPIANQKIFICDNSVKINYVGEYPLSRFCDGENRKIITEVFTDSTGVLVLDVKKIDVRPSFSIVFDTGDSDDWRGIVSVERSDSLAHTFHSSYIRVVNMEREGHVISNRLYNLDSKEVKEIFTSDGSEKAYTFDIIDLIVFKKGKEAKNCDFYEMPMTEEQIKECACSEGYKKFNSLMGVYCATDSRKPCNAHTDCPEGEHCISNDGNNWYCTGQWAGCYFRDPENPEDQICAD